MHEPAPSFPLRMKEPSRGYLAGQVGEGRYQIGQAVVSGDPKMLVMIRCEGFDEASLLHNHKTRPIDQKDAVS